MQGGAAPSWFDELNRDVRLRAVAGLGVRVVQEQQQALLAAAWDQVEGIRAVNKRIREAEMQKVPVMLVMGDRDVENGTVSVRRRGEGDLGAKSVEEAIASFKELKEAV